ncbi:hypothetical protein VNO80_14230 [Phaseolus coccineus]|uniref:Transcription repressor n=1 Tax=Phaseolus coccineus TaxID=3886 RepID=A0AAN9MHW7_PHACN
MKFFSLLKNNNTANNHHQRSSSSSSWPWPSCHQPRTLSFRATTAAATTNHDVFKGTNSTTSFVAQTPDSFFTDSPNSASFSSASNISRTVDPTETVIRGLRSDRLFFEPDQTSSIWEAKLATLAPFKNSVVFSMDSTHPYVDFRRSMEDMVATHSVTDWEDLEDLLCWFLKVNAPNTHHYILRAFVDFLFALALASSSSNAICSSTTTISSLSSSSSSCTTRCTFCFEEEVEHQHSS